MSTMKAMVLAAFCCMAAGSTMAQPGSGMGPGACAGAASAPAGCGGMGPGAMKGGGRWGPGVTPGWSLMTPEERNQHRDQMRSAKTYDECKTLQAQHHGAMAARAAERGGPPLPAPRRDPCAGLPK